MSNIAMKIKKHTLTDLKKIVKIKFISFFATLELLKEEETQMKRRTSKVISYTATIIVIVNLVTLLIVQNMSEAGIQSNAAGSVWSLITFLSVLALVLYLLSVCFENNK